MNSDNQIVLGASRAGSGESAQLTLNAASLQLKSKHAGAFLHRNASGRYTLPEQLPINTRSAIFGHAELSGLTGGVATEGDVLQELSDTLSIATSVRRLSCSLPFNVVKEGLVELRGVPGSVVRSWRGEPNTVLTIDSSEDLVVWLSVMHCCKLTPADEAKINNIAKQLCLNWTLEGKQLPKRDLDVICQWMPDFPDQASIARSHFSREDAIKRAAEDKFNRDYTAKGSSELFLLSTRHKLARLSLEICREKLHSHEESTVLDVTNEIIEGTISVESIDSYVNGLLQRTNGASDEVSNADVVAFEQLRGVLEAEGKLKPAPEATWIRKTFYNALLEMADPLDVIRSYAEQFDKHELHDLPDEQFSWTDTMFKFAGLYAQIEQRLNGLDGYDTRSPHEVLAEKIAKAFDQNLLRPGILSYALATDQFILNLRSLRPILFRKMGLGSPSDKSFAQHWLRCAQEEFVYAYLDLGYSGRKGGIPKLGKRNFSRMDLRGLIGMCGKMHWTNNTVDLITVGFKRALHQMTKQGEITNPVEMQDLFNQVMAQLKKQGAEVFRCCLESGFRKPLFDDESAWVRDRFGARMLLEAVTNQWDQTLDASANALEEVSLDAVDILFETEEGGKNQGKQFIKALQSYLRTDPLKLMKWMAALKPEVRRSLLDHVFRDPLYNVHAECSYAWTRAGLVVRLLDDAIVSVDDKARLSAVALFKQSLELGRNIVAPWRYNPSKMDNDSLRAAFQNDVDLAAKLGASLTRTPRVLSERLSALSTPATGVLASPSVSRFSSCEVRLTEYDKDKEQVVDRPHP